MEKPESLLETKHQKENSVIALSSRLKLNAIALPTTFNNVITFKHKEEWQ